MLLASYLYAAVCFQSLRKALPFSEPFAAARQREGMLLIPLMFVAFGFAGLHYAGTLVPFGLVAYIALLLTANVWAWKQAFRRL